jgi:hypothetical protein
VRQARDGHLPALLIVIPVSVIIAVAVVPLLGPLFASMVALGVETAHGGPEHGQASDEDEHSALHDGLLDGWMDEDFSAAALA